MSPFRPGRLIAAAAFALATAACAPIQVHSFADPGSNIPGYHTYGWDDKADQLITGDPRLDGNPFFHDRVVADVDRHLTDRGFLKAFAGSPDVLVHYHASFRDDINVNGADQKYATCNDCRPFVYRAGTLLIDVVDAKTNRLLWRGWAEGAMDGVVENQNWMEEKVDDAVARIMGAFPRRVVATAARAR